MTSEVMIDVPVQRGRLMTMIVVDAICVIVAAAAIVGDLSYHIAWLAWVFGAAVITGFGAQIWLVAGLGRRRGSV